MKKINMMLLIIVMVCSLAGCTSTCKVLGCKKDACDNGLCAAHALEKSRDEYNKSKDEIDRLQNEIDRIQDAIDRQSGNK